MHVRVWLVVVVGAVGRCVVYGTMDRGREAEREGHTYAREREGEPGIFVLSFFPTRFPCLLFSFSPLPLFLLRSLFSACA